MPEFHDIHDEYDYGVEDHDHEEEELVVIDHDHDDDWHEFQDIPHEVFDVNPEVTVHERHGEFYATEGLRILAEKIHPGGIFALWSDDPPEKTFMASLNEVFESCEHHIVPFHNPIQNEDFESTVYVARKKC